MKVLSKLRLFSATALAAVLVLSSAAPVSAGASLSPAASDGFSDVPASDVFYADIVWLAASGITKGCNPPANTKFCPSAPVTRAQMATFLVRALGLKAGKESFKDTKGNVHAADIAALAAAGITKGCNPPKNDRFCPDQPVTRAQMATFLARALNLKSAKSGFSDTKGNVHAADIAALAAAGITKGCNPPKNDRFCPDDRVSRGQMAAFLRRALDGSNKPNDGSKSGAKSGSKAGSKAGSGSGGSKTGSPKPPSSPQGKATDLAVDANMTCAVFENPGVWCWGENSPLGFGPRPSPTFVKGSENLKSIDMTGGTTLCGVNTEKAAYCWGYNFYGQVGNGKTIADGAQYEWIKAPSAVVGGHKFVQVEAGYDASCGIDTAGVAWCWGSNANGARGDGDPESAIRPGLHKVAGGHKFRSISVGGSHACAIKSEGSSAAGPVYCWGTGAVGQVGDGANEWSNPSPVPVAKVGGKTLKFKSVSAGGLSTCGITDAGVAYCWGRNNFGQLGVGDQKDRSRPTEVKTSVRFKSISVGGSQTCGISVDNVAYCWGYTISGSLGTGKLYDERLTPTKVSTDVKFQAIDVDFFHTCGIATSGVVYCWGANDAGQLGIGKVNADEETWPTTPQPVVWKK